MTLHADKLTVRYGDRFIFKEITLKVSSQSVMLIRGANGTGKSTLLQILAGIRRPLSGTVAFDGAVVCPSSPRTAANYRSRVGYLGHDLLLYRELSVRENLQLFSTGHSGNASFETGLALAESFGLATFLDRSLSSCSFGVAKKTSIVRALLHKPEVLLFDEPYSGLDSTSCAALSTVLSEQKGGGAVIVLSSHDEQMVADLVTGQFPLGD